MAIGLFNNRLGPGHVLNFLKARTPQGLRRLMFRNNLKHKAFIEYKDPVWVESEKSWYVWFFVTESIEKLEPLATRGEENG